jgi:metal-dependent hydrolase (beta-lactamase superfamily II)
MKQWPDYDACSLIKNTAPAFDDILIDVGTDDNFLKNGQLMPEALQNVNKFLYSHFS